jgi:hypothetical protein
MPSVVNFLPFVLFVSFVVKYPFLFLLRLRRARSFVVNTSSYAACELCRRCSIAYRTNAA